ncbi:Uncharacterised protein [Plesiomonas shigelloides]|uniref:hypothetical protein n=1 Tax=Plesiomonas shigelloides TaxID=703 RepID=UPI000E06EF37|nr:hypothetical protein [Plesiomonas shigelloides]SUB63233.1 Uncharacterised protein [Plesiomonas shigelloides]
MNRVGCALISLFISALVASLIFGVFHCLHMGIPLNIAEDNFIWVVFWCDVLFGAGFDFSVLIVSVIIVVLIILFYVVVYNALCFFCIKE